MGSGNHLRQPRPRISPVRVLRTETARGNQQLAAVRHPAARNGFQPVIGIGMKAKLEQVDTQLHCGRDLVDVLPTGSGRRKERLAQRLLGNIDIFRPHRATQRNNPAGAR